MNIKAAIITGNLINDVIFNSRLTIGAPLDTFDGGAQSTRTTITVTYHFSFHLFPTISYSRPRPSLMHTYVGPRKARCDFKQWKGHGSYILASRELTLRMAKTRWKWVHSRTMNFTCALASWQAGWLVQRGHPPVAGGSENSASARTETYQKHGSVTLLFQKTNWKTENG